MKIHREKFKTMHNVFDQFTERNIFKLVSQGYFEALESPISIGKEANVFSALRKDGTRAAIKIYRLSNCDFNKMHQYMLEDPRFVNVKRAKRDTIFAWAKREYMNLCNARDAGVNVPTAYGFLYNILIMEFIGNGEAAQKLTRAPANNPQTFLKEIIDNYRKLYRAKIVHGDLSPFNILNHHEHPVFIDMSQSTTLENPHAETYLKRDCRNLATFFAKHGVRITADELEEQITT